MIQSIGLTNREMLRRAMPLYSLSRVQWNELMNYMKSEEMEKGTDSGIYRILKLIISNQAKIEIINKYCLYYSEELDCPVSQDGFELNFS